MNEQTNETNSKKWMAPFFTIWTGQAFSLLGSSLVQFALVWWLTKETGSATILATGTLVALLPQILLGPVAGAIVDRWNRRLIMILADTSIAVATLVLALLFWSGNAEIWHVFILIFIRSLGGGFHWPAMQASTSLMVPKEHLARIQGANQTLQGLMGIGSAPLGALLMSLLPMQGVLGIDIITALMAIIPLFFIPVPQPERSTASEAHQEKSSLVQDLKAGLQYVWGWKGLLLIMGMAMLLNFLVAPAGSLQPILITKHFGGQAMELAWLEASFGIGMILGGIALGAWGGFRSKVITSLTGIIVLSLGLMGIGLVPANAFWAAILLNFIIGVAQPIVNGPLMAIMQSAVAPDMQGRVFTLLGSAAAAMMPLSLMVAGPLADAYGVRSWYVVGGLVAALVGAAAFFVPAIINVEKERQTEGQTEAPNITPLAASPVEISGD